MKPIELPTNRLQKTTREIRACIVSDKEYKQGTKLSATFDNVTCQKTDGGFIIGGLIPVVFDVNAVKRLKEPQDRIYLCTIPEHTLISCNGKAGVAKRACIVSEIPLELLSMTMGKNNTEGAFTKANVTIEP